MKVSYYLSAGGFGNGKSVCLWRNSGNQVLKIARFQSDEAAMLFAEEFNFPLSDALRERLQ
ncbi:MAG TPA: hypothetical protein DDY86_03895 [Syntrophaceae bacterium]|nr:hypothetical protein [Syntrophaceae bacterium]